MAADEAGIVRGLDLAVAEADLLGLAEIGPVAALRVRVAQTRCRQVPFVQVSVPKATHSLLVAQGKPVSCSPLQLPGFCVE